MIKISTDKSLLDVEMIHSFLTETYWAKDRTLKEVQITIDNSMCFGAYLNDRQIGFARVCTDYAVFVYIMDVFVLPEFRGNGFSKQLMDAVTNAPKLQSCQVWMLKTADAHGLYRHYGFKDLQHPEKVMEKITI